MTNEDTNVEIIDLDMLKISLPTRDINLSDYKSLLLREIDSKLKEFYDDRKSKLTKNHFELE